jgi:hypothetical protein
MQTFRLVTLPLVRNGLAVGFVTGFLQSFEELTITLFVGGGLKTTLSEADVGRNSFAGQSDHRGGIGCRAAGRDPDVRDHRMHAGTKDRGTTLVLIRRGMPRAGDGDRQQSVSQAGPAGENVLIDIR